MGKLSINELANVLVEKNELNEGDAQRFVTAIFDVIQKGIDRDKLVKIKGFGTFKVVGVDARESVNVNTGERVLIESHSKISFTPDTTMKELVNKPFSGFETVVLNEGVYFDDMSGSAAAAEEPVAEEPAVETTVRPETPKRPVVETFVEPTPEPEPEPVVETFVAPEPTQPAVEQTVRPEVPKRPVVETFVEPTPEPEPVVAANSVAEPVVETFVAPEPVVAATPVAEPVVETFVAPTPESVAEPIMDEPDDAVPMPDDAIPMPAEAEEPVYQETPEQPMVDEHMIEIVDEPDDAIPMPDEADYTVSMVSPEIPEQPVDQPVYEAPKPEPQPFYEEPKPQPVYEAPQPEPQPIVEPVVEEEELEPKAPQFEETPISDNLYEEKQSSGWGKWLIVAVFTLVAGFVGGYFVGNDFSLNYDKLLSKNTEEQPVETVKETPVKKVEQPAPVEEQPAVEEEAPKADPKAAPVKATAKAESTKSTKKTEPAKTTKKTEPAKTTATTEHDKYAAMDNRVRLGAYRIVGLDKEVTVREGDNVERVSRRYLGSGMSCYVEVYNGINSKTPLKAGQKLKIPKLEWKKKKK